MLSHLAHRFPVSASRMRSLMPLPILRQTLAFIYWYICIAAVHYIYSKLFELLNYVSEIKAPVGLQVSMFKNTCIYPCMYVCIYYYMHAQMIFTNKTLWCTLLLQHLQQQMHF